MSGRLVVLALVLLVASVTPARAQPEAPPPPANFFTDTAGVVSGDVASRLEQKLRQFETTTSNQLLVVVADRLPEGYASVEEYANRTAQAWRVGNKSRDNGAVLFVFVSDRKIRIEVGYGLEGALPDALASRIIAERIAPRFREGEYGPGLLAGVDAIIQATRGEYEPLAPQGSTTRRVLIGLAILFFVFFGLIFPVWNEIMSIRRYRTYSSRGSTGGRFGGTWGGDGRAGGSGGRWSGGGGSSWSGGGGGFSGGGGSFGGGGASGSW